MATVTNQYFIGLGTPTETVESFEVVETGATGTPGALRTLTHPDSANSPTVTYFRNPDRTINFLSQPLKVPTATTRRTLGTTLPLVESSDIDDVRVTERWEGSNNRAAMPASFFKLLFEQVINIPTTGFVIWNPLDLVSDGTQYNVVLLDLRVGGSSLNLDVKELGADQLAGLDNVPTGVIDRTVELDFLIRSVVV